MSRNRQLSAQDQELHMPAVVEARAMLCAIPLDLARGESKGVWLLRASRLLGIAPALGKRLYYGELKRIDADTFFRMRRRSRDIDLLNRRLDALKAAEVQHTVESHAIRRDLAAGRQRGGMAGGTAQPGGEPLEEDSGMVPGPTD